MAAAMFCANRGQVRSVQRRRRFRQSIAAAALCAAAAVPTAVRADEHEDALAALRDLEAATSEIEHAADVSEGGQEHFLQLGHRAINDLVGAADSLYRRGDGGTGDPTGALGHLNRLLESSKDAPWLSAVSGALLNTQGAVAHLQTAVADRGIDRFHFDATDALASLEMAVGRPSELSALGGLSGALANTVLGVPSGERVVSACDKPPVVPAYGVAAGYLVYVALPLDHGEARLPPYLGVRRIGADNQRLILYTAAEELLPALCERQRETMAFNAFDGVDYHDALREPGALQLISFSPSLRPAGSLMFVAAHSNTQATPKLYTEKQAEAGKEIYETKCVSCHGKNLQGTAAPAVAGREFLDTAQRNGWTMEDMRSIVFYNMPFNAPGSLSADQYADVMAYLLAENCYPAGSKPFPKTDEPALQKVPLEVVAEKSNASSSDAGVCEVK